MNSSTFRLHSEITYPYHDVVHIKKSASKFVCQIESKGLEKYAHNRALPLTVLAPASPNKMQSNVVVFR